MNNEFGIRDQIIITDDCPKIILLEYSDIELAAIYSKNKNNLIIFKNLLLKINNQTVNKLLISIIKKETSSIDAIKLLIAHEKINVNYKDSYGWTPLIFSCIHLHNIKIIELLIESGANINIKSHGKTLIMFAIRNSSTYRHLEIIKLLIKKDSKINYQDHHGITPLMSCFVMHFNALIRYDIIKLLLDNKVDIYIKDNKGNDIFKYMKKTSNQYLECRSLIFNYKNLVNDHFCKYDIDFIY